METARVKIFTIRKGDACVEWFKTPYVDMDAFFDEEHVEYNDRSFYETLLRHYRQWEKEGRPFASFYYPNKLIWREIGFIEYVDGVVPDLVFTNNASGWF